MGKSSSATVGYWYKVLFHAGLGVGPFDAFLQFRGGDKSAWSGELTSSGTISINAPNLWGGEKDQGGIVGDVDVMFGEATQAPNAYLLANLGPQVPAWRGMATLVFKGGRYGAMNPYPQKASYKIRKIKKGWDTDPCWYPEKAEIVMVSNFTLPADAAGWEFQSIAHHANPGFENLTEPTAGWLTGPGPFSGGTTATTGSEWPPETVLWARRSVDIPAGSIGQRLRVTAENGCVVFVNGVLVGAVNRENIQIENNQNNTFEFELANGATYDIVVKAFDEETLGLSGTFLSVEVLADGLIAMNPAHVLYYARTHSSIGREPTASINDASFRAAADKLYAEGFGICTEYDPSAESLEEFEQRICRLIGGSVSRSLVDGQWYLDLARGDYVLASLPVLTDDDILEFSEQPTTLDGATNSISIKYFDPQRKERVVTPPVQALSLVDAFGTIHQANEYAEIPVASLASRVGERDLRTTVTPTRAFELTTTRKPYAWRPNQYFRLQALKRGIADMVCIVGEKQSGTLRSGAIKLKATQDIYSLPATTFVEIEPGVDTRPPETPTPVALQHAFEAPYVEVVATVPRAELQALPVEVGYLLAVAVDPAVSRDFTLMVAPDGGEYSAEANGEWCPSSLVVEAAGPEDTAFTLSNATRVGDVVVGMPALWGSELVRVDAIDASANTVEFARGCADTVPAPTHASGERVWFYAAAFAADTTEYTDGESVDVKLLTNTGSRQVDLSIATPMSVTFDQRLARPYPPARVRVNAEAWPIALTGALTVEWAHRDRVLQADQIVDTEAASIGPEAGTTYTLRWYLDESLVQTHSGVTGTSQLYSPPADGLLRIEIESVRDGLTSWQMQVREFFYTTFANFIETDSGVVITLDDGTPISLE